MKIANPVGRLLFVFALSIVSFPLFANAVQEKELNGLLALKSGGSRSAVERSDGVTQTADGDFMEFSNGQLTIRTPLEYGLENAQQIIALLNGGFSANDIAGKWTVSEGSEFVSFEFHESTFIAVRSGSPEAVQNTPLVYTGSYAIGNNEVSLGDFGVIWDIKLAKGITREEMTFNFSPGGSGDLETLVKVYKELSNEAELTPETNMLCRTWKLVRRDGAETQNTPYEETILFTKAGTYLVTYPDGAVGLSQWRWKSSEQKEKEFEYSWNANWEDVGVSKIEDLQPNYFKVKDKANVVYEFIPY
jgi:hypothetical protein